MNLFKLKNKDIRMGSNDVFWSFYWAFPARVALTYVGENILV